MYDTRAFFNEHASAWDSKSIQNTQNLETMLHLCDLKPGACILDVGCGTGLLERYLMEYEPAMVLAVDFAENMIALAKEKFSHPDVEFVCSDFFDITGLTFDACFFLNAFPHFTDPKRAVNHLTRLLKIGGRVAISHSQGKGGDDSGIFTPMLPAQGLLNLLRPYFRLDVMVDNNVMFMISGTKLDYVKD